MRSVRLMLDDGGGTVEYGEKKGITPILVKQGWQEGSMVNPVVKINGVAVPH